MKFDVTPKDRAISLMTQYRSKKKAISYVDELRDDLNDSVFANTNKDAIDKYDYYTQVKIWLEKLY